jgi:hypothetical protein
VDGKASGEVYLGARLEARADEIAGAQQEAVEVGPARGGHGDEAGDGRLCCRELCNQMSTSAQRQTSLLPQAPLSPSGLASTSSWNVMY